MPKTDMKINDMVRIKRFPVDHINATARVVAIRGDMIVVSNLGMPFCGNLANVLFNRNEVEAIR